ncbi:MAG: hypothetical protein ACXWJ8_14180 [Xanthobacteraceae bacterium]
MHAVRRITRPFLIVLAIAFLIEAWLWRHLEPIVEWIVAWLPLRAVKARLAGIIRKLPPAATLVVFVVPIAVLFPLKVLGLWLLAHKYWIAAGGVLVFAKLVGLAVTAFVFKVTRPKLLQLRWFRWLYEHVLMGLDWAHRLVAPVRRRIRRLLRILRAKQTGRALRLLWRIRHRMRAARSNSLPPLSEKAVRVARSPQRP